jgi:hypothetical protein
VANEILGRRQRGPEAIRPLVDQAEEIYVIAPTLTRWLQWVSSDVDGARVAADERFQRAVEHMHADGLKPKGSIEAEEPSRRHNCGAGPFAFGSAHGGLFLLNHNIPPAEG